MTLADVVRPRFPGRKRKLRPVTVAASPWSQPTLERMRHAEAAGLVSTVEAYLTDEGAETGLKRQRLVSPLELLWRSGELSGEQFAAARRYADDAGMAAVVGPGQSVRYEPRGIQDSGGAFLSPIEAAAEFLIKLARAQEACTAQQRRMLVWIAFEPSGWRAQAALWFRGFSEVRREQRFKGLLRDTTNTLARHYEWTRRR